MESWRNVWRKGLAPQFSNADLSALWTALLTDDSRLVQRATCLPPPLEENLDLKAERACAVSLPCLLRGTATVGEIEGEFARLCFWTDERMGEPAACRYFLNWFDEASRDDVRRLLLQEVDAELQRRASAVA